MSNRLAEGVREGVGSADSPPRLLIIPDDVAEVDDPAAASSAPAPKPPQARAWRVARAVGYVFAGALVGAAAFRVFSTPTAHRPAGSRPGRAASDAAVPPSLGTLADTLALAVASFELRTRLFASHQMQCPDLARGLVLVEERWAVYNSARRGEAIALDSSRDATDRSLYSRVDAAERRFEQSACPRP